MKEKEKNTVKLKEGIDGLMLIVKKLRELIDQKDERIKELSRKLQATSAIKKTQLNNRVKK
jgi:flagellar biosynthesis chaperone FliJ